MTAKRGAAKSKKGGGFTAEEKAAMKDRVRELKREGKGDGEGEVLAKIAAMQEPDRSMAKRLHLLIRNSLPELSPRTWYGMPAYARDGKVVCFFQDARKFKTRYSTIGFSDAAMLDDGEMWPTAFALKSMTRAGEAAIVKLLKRAVGR